MGFQRKTKMRNEPGTPVVHKENHVKNISIMLACVIGGLTVKIILGGIAYDENGSAISKAFTSQMMTDMEGMTSRIDHTPNPKVIAEVDGMKAEVEKLRKDNRELTLLSRGSFDRGGTVQYNHKKLSAPRDITDLIMLETAKLHPFDDRYKEFFEAIYSIVSYESHFNPKTSTKTSTEYSLGLLQVNTYTNYPKNADINDLFDPEFNLQYQLPELYNMYILGKSKGLAGASLAKYIARYGQRYNYDDRQCRQYVEGTIDRMYVELANARITQ